MLLDSVRSPEKKEVMRLVQEDMIEELEAHRCPDSPPRRPAGASWRRFSLAAESPSC